ncbi:hypothetical protein ACLI1A_15730 [Flavobacterium sp. RHBU_3]|uniref:hypothetical protein n=1 Tax=Flavobacterium sp. RHBU_3 TaxID=3391184 RepID=UPI0039852DE9
MDYKRVTVLLALLSIVTFSCKSEKATVKTYMSKNKWTTDFKQIVVYSCMCELTENQTRTVLKSHGDFSFADSPLFLTGYDSIANVVGRTEARKIKPLYANTEIGNGKAIFSSCLSLYNNKQIHKIALKNYKAHKSKLIASQSNN